MLIVLTFSERRLKAHGPQQPGSWVWLCHYHILWPEQIRRSSPNTGFYKIRHYQSNICPTAQGALRFSFQPLTMIGFYLFLLSYQVPAVFQRVSTGSNSRLIVGHDLMSFLMASPWGNDDASWQSSVLMRHLWGGAVGKDIPRWVINVQIQVKPWQLEVLGKNHIQSR